MDVSVTAKPEDAMEVADIEDADFDDKLAPTDDLDTAKLGATPTHGVPIISLSPVVRESPKPHFFVDSHPDTCENMIDDITFQLSCLIGDDEQNVEEGGAKGGAEGGAKSEKRAEDKAEEVKEETVYHKDSLITCKLAS